MSDSDSNSPPSSQHHDAHASAGAVTATPIPIAVEVSVTDVLSADDANQSHSQSAPPPRRSRRRRLRSILISSTLILGVVAAATSLIIVSLMRAAPGWWDVVDSSDPKLISHGVNLENAVVNALSSPKGVITLRLTQADANIWLNTRLRPWLESQGDHTLRIPDQVRDLRVDFRDDQLHVGARVEENGASQIFTALLSPRFGNDGALWLTADDVSLGRLTIPASWVLGSTNQSESAAAEKTREVSEELAKMPQTQRVLSAFAGKNPIHSRPVLKLPDGRRFRMTALSCSSGKLSITLTPEPRDRSKLASVSEAHKLQPPAADNPVRTRSPSSANNTSDSTLQQRQEAAGFEPSSSSSAPSSTSPAKLNSK